MAVEAVPAGQVSDGFGLVLFVPTIANPAAPTVAELSAGTVKKLTYSLTGDGFVHNTTINTVTASRYTLPQQIQYDGTITDDIEIKYVYNNTASDVARLALPAGTTGFIVERYAYANDLAIVAAQIVDVIPIKASVQRRTPPATNTELTITQKLNVTGTVQRAVVVAA